ncbi:MAG: DAK2 domain-containing protein [Clostridia bacterium]|nr:DAK2 domain-containing protein [Clostridia bacterium]
MLEQINGSCYKGMIAYGINNLDKHCSTVNDLNVFPVPDGDTGTNMVMTMRNGMSSIESSTDSLSAISQRFANATVYGARGNSGVIVSQFFKGVSEGLKDLSEADCLAFSKALDKGCEYAYNSVANPVEGTILTVIKDATATVRANIENIHSMEELVSKFLAEARISLDNTPELLPILKKAGVVDSGGAGIVYFFEGIQKYLNGEKIEAVESKTETQYIDYSAFDKNSSFEYGYCTELLIQLTSDKEEFDYADFGKELGKLGESIVTSFESDKVKVHIHTFTPEKILTYCHRFGEFLSLKIENMSVQHTQTTQKYLCAEAQNTGSFAVVAVAPNALLQNMLAEMGADVVILSSESPSSQEFIESFEQIDKKEILVFPNSSNSILSAMQAGSLYKKAKITVLNCRSIPKCYSSLALIDFESDINTTVSTVNDTIGNIYEVSIIHASKNIAYGDKTVVKNDYFALSGDDILETGDRFDEVVLRTVREVTSKKDCSVVNMFYGKNAPTDQLYGVADEIGRAFDCLETYMIPTQDNIYDLILSFE